MSIIVGVIWKLASWKDTALEYISQKLNISIDIISQELKNIAREQSIEINRENLCELWKNIAHEFWDDYLAQRILDKNIEKEIILVGWMRQVWQIKLFQNAWNFILINIHTDEKIRYQRMIKRNLPWDPKNLEQFNKIENIDDGWQWVQNISECEKYANYQVTNNWDKQKLFQQLDEIIKNIKT